MRRRTKILAPAVASVAAITVPLLFFTGMIPIEITSQELFAIYEVEELVEGSAAIVKGEIKSSRAILAGTIDRPEVMTIYEISPEEFLKGGDGGSGYTVSFMEFGGRYNNMVQKTYMPQFDVGERVILMLGRADPASVFEGHYYIAGVHDGVFRLEGDQAVSHNSTKTMSEKELVGLIHDQLGK